MPLAGMIAGIARVHCKTGEEIHPATQRLQGRVMRHDERQKRRENVRLGDGHAELLQDGFQVLFGGLLTMKAQLIMKRLAAARDGGGELEVAFCFSHPLARGPFHRGPCPWS